MVRPEAGAERQGQDGAVVDGRTGRTMHCCRFVRGEGAPSRSRTRPEGDAGGKLEGIDSARRLRSRFRAGFRRRSEGGARARHAQASPSSRQSPGRCASVGWGSSRITLVQLSCWHGITSGQQKRRGRGIKPRRGDLFFAAGRRRCRRGLKSGGGDLDRGGRGIKDHQDGLGSRSRARPSSRVVAQTTGLAERDGGGRACFSADSFLRQLDGCRFYFLFLRNAV